MIEKIKENWDKILLTLKEEHEISNISYSTWLEPLKPHSFKDNTVTIIVPEQTFLQYVNKKYGFLLKVTISEFLEKECEVDFKVKEQIVEAEEPAAPQLIKNNKASVSPDVIQSANLNPKYTFDTFVVGGNNNLAHAAALAVAESPGEIYNPLFIYGGVGLGKTHLMHAIAHFILKNNAKSKILYVTSETFTNELIDAIRNKNNITTTEFREKYRNNDVLLIDDIQFIIGKESTQEEFFHTFNTLYESGRQIVLTSDRPPSEMTQLEDRLRTRFEWGLLVDVAPPDFETRLAIVKNKAALLGMELPDKISAYIAENVTANVRQLEGTINKILAYKDLLGNDTDEETVTRAIQDMLRRSNEYVPTPEAILEYISKYYSLDESVIRGQQRVRDAVSARQIAMYLIRSMTNLSLDEIGKVFDNRDHSTVLYSIQQIEKKMKKDAAFAEMVKEIKTNINSKR